MAGMLAGMRKVRRFINFNKSEGWRALEGIIECSR
jgi:hypothetical protein